MLHVETKRVLAMRPRRASVECARLAWLSAARAQLTEPTWAHCADLHDAERCWNAVVEEAIEPLARGVNA